MKDEARLPNYRPVNILMVDDTPAKLLSYEAILGELNENLVKANSGREALELLLKTDFAVVLMDVSMPEMDGYELAEMIRQHPRFNRTAIIFVSAVHLTDLDRLRGYQRGAVDYISVPVNPELLRAKVMVFAELHRKKLQLEAANQELRHLSGTLLNLQDNERRRVARELHDGLGQDLTVSKMLLDRLVHRDGLAKPELETATRARDVVAGVLQQVRSMSYLLHPPMLDEIGLTWALQWYLEGLAKRGEVKFTLEVQPPEFPRLATQVETTVFRIVQEALTNILRHSGVTEGSVRLQEHDGRLLLTVRDPGRGVSDDIVHMRPGAIGVGLSGMLQRVKELGGELRIVNLHPGTMVEVAIPVQKVRAPAPAKPASVTTPGVGEDPVVSKTERSGSAGHA